MFGVPAPRERRGRDDPKRHPGDGRQRSGHPLRRSATSCAATANKSARTRARRTPRGCRPASRTARAGGETDSTRQMCAPRPTATGPGHSHARCDAWPARARCDESEDQMTLAPAFGPIGGIWTGLVTPVHRADGTTVYDRPRPINLVVAREPIQQRKVDQIPHARQLPIAQSPPARHPRSAPEFPREHMPGNAAAKDEDNACEARAIRDARPPTVWPSRWNR